MLQTRSGVTKRNPLPRGPSTLAYDYHPGRVGGCDRPDLPLDVMQNCHDGITAAIFDVLGVDNSVRSRMSYGGTAPDRVRDQIARWKEALS